VAKVTLFASPFDNDDVGYGSRDGQITRKCAGHSECEPSRRWVSTHESKDIEVLEVEMLAET
jgi:hypothetical protein